MAVNPAESSDRQRSDPLLQKHHQLAAEARDEAGAALAVLRNVKLEGDGVVEGLSLLHLKNLIMVDYLSDLAFVMLKKSFGKSIAEDPAVGRVVENRTVLEKLRPMEKKLKYQVDKYVRLAGKEPGDRRLLDDPLSSKPNLGDLEEEGEEEDGGKKYVVPKHVPTLCEDDLTAGELEEREEKSRRKKTLSRAIVEDLKRQYADVPEENFERSDMLKAEHIRQMRERRRYEEENYTRLPALSKKERHGRRSAMTTMGVLGDEITQFGANNFFDDDGEGGGASASAGKKRGKKRAGGGKSKGSARKKFKRRM